MLTHYISQHSRVRHPWLCTYVLELPPPTSSFVAFLRSSLLHSSIASPDTVAMQEGISQNGASVGLFWERYGQITANKFAAAVSSICLDWVYQMATAIQPKIEPLGRDQIVALLCGSPKS